MRPIIRVGVKISIRWQSDRPSIDYVRNRARVRNAMCMCARQQCEFGIRAQPEQWVQPAAVTALTVRTVRNPIKS